MASSGRQRLLAILARLGGLREECMQDPAIVDATHAEVADISNLSRSVVTRFLQEFDLEGLVRPGRAAIEIPEPQLLLASIERAG
jgi:CRP-like cAMP-binding protein